MLIFLAAALVVVWVLAFVVLHITSALIHLLLFGAGVFIVIRLFSPPISRSDGARIE